MPISDKDKVCREAEEKTDYDQICQVVAELKRSKLSISLVSQGVDISHEDQ